ncbi:MAG: hypothetical protein QM747_14935 [Nocardioides sp.]
MTRLDERLTEALATMAEEAPRPDGLLEAARSRHRRRRRAQVGVAAVAALAVAVPVGLVGFGRDGTSEPEPLGPYRYGQHQKISSAVPVAQAHGFRTLDYGVPSHSPLLQMANGDKLAPIGEYVDIDAEGRLTAMRVQGPHVRVSYQLVPGAGLAAQELASPVGHSIERGIWAPSFTPDGRLLWSRWNGQWIHQWLTDDHGGDAREVTPSETAVHVPPGVVGQPWRGLWVDGGRVWFSAVTKVQGSGDDPLQWISLFSYDPAHPDQVQREAASDVAAIQVANGEAVWIDRSTTRVFAEDLATQQVREVPLSLDPGCRLEPMKWLSQGGQSSAVVTNGSLVATTEFCGDWRTTREVVTDLSGRRVTEIDPGPGHQVYDVELTDQTMSFMAQGPEPVVHQATYLDDLGTGQLIDLGAWNHDMGSMQVAPTIAGRYVVWYADGEGHVGRLDPSPDEVQR